MDEETKKRLIEWIEKNSWFIDDDIGWDVPNEVVDVDNLKQAIQSGEFDKPDEKETA